MSSAADSSHRAHHVRREARRIAVLDHQLRDCLRRLEAARRDIEVMRAGLSHVVHNRLPVVERLTDRLGRRHAGRAHPMSPADLTRASEELRRIGQLLEQLITLGDIDRRRITLRPLDLTAIAWEIIGRLRTREPQRSVDVHVAADLRIEGDKDLLEMLLTVLLEDAWQRTSRADQAGIQIGCTAMESETVCFVRDNGEGFDHAPVAGVGGGQRVAAPSRRWSNFRLVIARRIVERLGGRLWVDACPGIGATVCFTVAPVLDAALG